MSVKRKVTVPAGSFTLGHPSWVGRSASVYPVASVLPSQRGLRIGAHSAGHWPLAPCGTICLEKGLLAVRAPWRGPVYSCQTGDDDDGATQAFTQAGRPRLVPAVRQADSAGSAEAPGSVLLARLCRGDVRDSFPSHDRKDSGRRGLCPHTVKSLLLRRKL